MHLIRVNSLNACARAMKMIENCLYGSPQDKSFEFGSDNNNNNTYTGPNNQKKKKKKHLVKDHSLYDTILLFGEF